MKPGWQTSEFWIAVATQIVTVLVLTGFIAPADRETFQGAITNGIAAAATLASSAAVLWRYIQSRELLKQHAIEERLKGFS